MIIQKLNVHSLFRPERRVKRGIGFIPAASFTRVLFEKLSLKGLNGLESLKRDGGSISSKAPLNRRACKQIFKDRAGPGPGGMEMGRVERAAKG